ncbi:MAG: sigma-70 family RNA polymerase sigma factor [Prevotella sp.]|nr:sigma-70 family RNA polymerase sigma factor [Prevotella sp.]
MTTEKDLIEAFTNDRRAAGRCLYERYGGQLMAVCMRYMGGSDEARDVMQDSFVKILSQMARFEYRGEGSLAAWMKRITVNEALSHLRTNHKMRLLEEPHADIPDEEDTQPERVPPNILQQMIGQLPAGYRTVLNLFVFEQIPHKEIARRLGITESTSGSQYLRAKKMLAKQINEYLKVQEKS